MWVLYDRRTGKVFVKCTLKKHAKEYLRDHYYFTSLRSHLRLQKVEAEKFEEWKTWLILGSKQ